MSDHAQILVAIDCPPAEAAARAKTAIDLLVARGIVEERVSDCTLGGGSRGHLPGPAFDAVIESTDRDAQHVRGLWTNGVAARTGRTIFDSGSNGIELRCPGCEHTFEPRDDWYRTAASRVLGGRVRVVRQRI